MAIQAKGGAGGAGGTQNGADGGNAGQTGAGTFGGAAGTFPSGNGANGGTGGETSVAGSGGGGGADGQVVADGSGIGGRGGEGASGVASVSGDGDGGGGGGGGGAGGIVTTSVTSNEVSQGGDGGDGGEGSSMGAAGNGGSGGGGGDGLVMADSGLTLTITDRAFVAGGAGGDGASGSSFNQSYNGAGGAGGDGGDGIFAYDGNTLVNSSYIGGGAAGESGSGTSGSGTSAAGTYAAFGAGVVGSNLTLTNAGTIIGGRDSSNNVRGNALTFTSGSNTLTLSSGGTVGTINGNIAVSGTLDIRSGGAAADLSGNQLVFSAAGTAVTIESGVTLEDKVASFAAGDALDFRAVAYSTKLEAVFTASATGGNLRIVDSTHPTVVVAQATMVGAYTSGVFGLSNDGSNGTEIGFAATPSLGMQPNDVATSSIPGSAALVVVDRYNADYSLYQEDTITKASNGNYTFHFQGGSYFTGKTFQSFDNVTNSAGLLLNQTLYGANGLSYQYTTFNANGTAYQQAAISRPVAGEILYHYDAGSFFTGKPYSAFDNLATTGGTLLDQILDNNDGSHTFTVPGSNLTLTAQKNDTFNVTGQNETTRFNATGFKADTFTGYKAGDIFSFSTSIFANYTALQQHLSGTSSAVITDTAGDTLTLANVAKSSVTSGMFAFS